VSETQRLSEQVERAYAGDAWHGPSVREALDGVTAQLAMARPIADAHSIWEIVAHLAAWNTAIVRRLGGERLDTPDEGDWPAVRDTSEAGWKEALAWLERGYAELKDAVGKLQPTRWEDAGEWRFSPYVMIVGTLQHYAYHAGQIALLKKAAARAGPRG
jgi:uncharacterized damage-inducible protein DinB